MADDNNDKDVKGHLLTPDEISNWGNETNFIEPGTTEEGNATNANSNQTAAPQDGQTTDDDNANDAGEAPEEEYQESPQPQPVEDPGEFEPKDYSFEVVTYDEEGKHPKVNKIKSLDEWEALVDSDPNFGTSGALLKAQRLATKMEYGSERDQAEWQKSKDAYDKYAGDQQARVDHINNVAAEINYLVDKGLLPSVAKELEDKDWRDPEVAKQPGVKEQVELLNYMRKENDRRIKAGLKSTIMPIDAYNAMQLDTKSKEVKDSKKAAGQARQQAGSRVASQSPAPMSSNAPKGIAIGRGGSLRDINPGWN